MVNLNKENTKLLYLISISMTTLFACRSLFNANRSKLKSNAETAEIFEGHATYFESLGVPTGGCGVPEGLVDSKSYVALNVQHTPGNYEDGESRPLSDPDKVGTWNNGKNCGRWVRVELSNVCEGGVHNGTPGNLCNGGNYVDDENIGAVQDMVVTDSCQDGNAWCRDDRYHLDLSKYSLSSFKKDGEAAKSVQVEGWSNRKVKWQFIPAPNYDGDIKIYFIPDSKLAWPAILINHLPNGIHKVEYESNNQWTEARMNSDLGQQFILGGQTPNYRIRIYDVDDKLLNNGRIYKFSSPCANSCSDFSEARYTTEAGTGVDEPADPSTDINDPSRLDPNPNPSPSQKPEPSKPNSDSKPSVEGLTVALQKTSSYGTGYCTNIIIKNGSKAAIDRWSIELAANDAVINQSWNLKLKKNGQTYIMDSEFSWQSIPANGQLESSGFCADLKAGGKEASFTKISGS